MTAKTLYDKLWDAHLVETLGDDAALIYIDRHLLHEVARRVRSLDGREDLGDAFLDADVEATA